MFRQQRLRCSLHRWPHIVLAVVIFIAISATIVSGQENRHIQYGETVQDAFTPTLSYIAYTFTAQAGDEITISVMSDVERLAPGITLFDPNLRQIAISSDTNDAEETDISARLSTHILASGTHVIGLWSRNSMTGDFELSLTLEGAPAVDDPSVTPTSVSLAFKVEEFALEVSSFEPVTLRGVIASPTVHMVTLTFVHHDRPMQPQTFELEVVCSADVSLLVEGQTACAGGLPLHINVANETPGFAPESSIDLNLVTPEEVGTEYNLIITPLTPLLAIAPEQPHRIISAYSDRVTEVTGAISQPYGNNSDVFSIRFPDLKHTQPQNVRFSLACTGSGDWMVYHHEAEGCGSSFTTSLQASSPGLAAEFGLNIGFHSHNVAANVAYTLRIEPLPPLVPVAPVNNEPITIVAPSSEVTIHTGRVSAPYGNTSDQIQVRVRDVVEGELAALRFSLLCSGERTHWLNWETSTGLLQLCGGSFVEEFPAMDVMLGAQPGIDMAMNLAPAPEAAYVDYTLIIAPADMIELPPPQVMTIPAGGTAQVSGWLPPDNPLHTFDVNVTGIPADQTTTIHFSLACTNQADLETESAQIVMSGVLESQLCNQSFTRTFTPADAMAAATISLVEGSDSSAYMLTASPAYPTAPWNDTVFTLPLAIQNPTYHHGTLSAPEGNTADHVMLSASQISDNLPLSYTLSLACQGPGQDSLRLTAVAGTDIGCGESFDQIITSAETQPVIEVELSGAAEPAYVDYAITAVLTEFAGIPAQPVTETINVSASSTSTTTLTRALSSHATHLLRVRFDDLIVGQAQPQTFRFHLTCSGVGDEGLLWVRQDSSLRCGDEFVELFAPQDGVTAGLDMVIEPHEAGIVTLVGYTLTIEPLTPLLATAPTMPTMTIDIDPVNQPVVQISGALSAPFGANTRSFTLNPLTPGPHIADIIIFCTGSDLVIWSIGTVAPHLCGLGQQVTISQANTLNHDLDIILTATSPTYVDFTLLITFESVTTTPDTTFDISLTGPTTRTGRVLTNQAHPYMARVPGIDAGSPRTIVFELACGGAGASKLRLQMDDAAIGCGGSRNVVFASAEETRSLNVGLSAGDGVGDVQYILTAQPLYPVVAPADAEPHTILVNPTARVTVGEAISYPEGDREDQFVLDRSQLQADQLPRTFALTIACEGSGASNLSAQFGDTIFGCGDAVDVTFTARGMQDGGRDAPDDPRDLFSSHTRTATVRGGDPAALTVRIPEGGPQSMVYYVVAIEPKDFLQPVTSPQTVEHVVNVSSFETTTFSGSLQAQAAHKVTAYYSDLINTHHQQFDINLVCTGPGTSRLTWYLDNGDILSCGGTFGEFADPGFTLGDTPPGRDMVLAMDDSPELAQVNFQLIFTPTSPRVPIAPEADNVSITITMPAVYSHSGTVSAPLGNSADTIYAVFPAGMSGEDAGFIVTCAGVRQHFTRLALEAAGISQQAQCNELVTLPLPVVEGPNNIVTLTLHLHEAPLPAYTEYTLNIIPPDSDTTTLTPFPTLPVMQAIPLVPSATPTPLPTLPLMQAVTLAPTATPTPLQGIVIIAPTATPTSLQIGEVLPIPSPTSVPLAAPQWIAPAEEATFISEDATAITYVTFRWEPVPGATAYRLRERVCAPTCFASTERTIASGTEYTLSVGSSGLLDWAPSPGSTLEVSVRAMNNYDTSTGRYQVGPASELRYVAYGAGAPIPTAVPTSTPTTEPIPTLPPQQAIVITTPTATRDPAIIVDTPIPVRVTSTPTMTPPLQVIIITTPTATRDQAIIVDTPIPVRVTSTPTPEPAQSPVLTAPEDGAVLPFTGSVTYTWEPLPLTFRYLIEREACNADYSDCTPLTPVTTDSSQITLDHNDLRPAVRWRVRSTFADGTAGPFSEWATFWFDLPIPTPTVFPTLPPQQAIVIVPTATPTPLPQLEGALLLTATPTVAAPPQPLEPADGVVTIADQITLRWSGVSAGYQVEYQYCWLADGFCFMTITRVTTANEWSVDLPYTADVRVNWRVRGYIDGTPLTAFSETRSFTGVFLPTATPTPTSLPLLQAVTLAPSATATTEPISTLPPQVMITLAPTATPSLTPTVTPPLDTAFSYFDLNWPREGGSFSQTILPSVGDQLNITIDGLTGSEADIYDYTLRLTCPFDAPNARWLVLEIDGMNLPAEGLCEGPNYAVQIPLTAGNPGLTVRLFFPPGEVDPGSPATPYTLEMLPAGLTFEATEIDPASGLPIAGLHDRIFVGLGAGTSAVEFNSSYPHGYNVSSIRLYLADPTLLVAGIAYDLRLECDLDSGDHVNWQLSGIPNLPTIPATCGDVRRVSFVEPWSFADVSVYLENVERPVYKTFRLVAAPVNAIAPFVSPITLPLSFEETVSARGALSFPQGMMETYATLVLPPLTDLPEPLLFETTVTCTGAIEPLRWFISDILPADQPPDFSDDPLHCGDTLAFAISYTDQTPRIGLMLDYPQAQSFVNFTLTIAPLSPPPDSDTSQTEDQHRNIVFSPQGGTLNDRVVYGLTDFYGFQFIGLDETWQFDAATGTEIPPLYAFRYELTCEGVGAESLVWELSGQEHEHQVTGVYGCGDSLTQIINVHPGYNNMSLSLPAEAAPADADVRYTLQVTPLGRFTPEAVPAATPSPAPLRSTDTPLPPRPTSTPAPLRATNTPIPLRPTVTPIPPRATDTPAPLRATDTPIPPRATNTPTSTPTPRATETPIPARATSTPTVSQPGIAPIDRDHSVVLNVGESRSFADDVSFPEGDTSDVIVIRMDGLRQPADYLLTLNCSGQGTEFIAWSARRISSPTGCGRGVQVTFSPDNDRIIVDIGFTAGARPSYVRYSLDIVPVRR